MCERAGGGRDDRSQTERVRVDWVLFVISHPQPSFAPRLLVVTPLPSYVRNNY